MNKISIIKKIQIGEKAFPIENPYAELNFSFYCGNGGLKHQTILSMESSILLSSLLESEQVNSSHLAKNDVDKLENLENKERIFPYRYKIFSSVECNNSYLIIFDINEYRGYYSCYVYAVLQIESTISNNNYDEN